MFLLIGQRRAEFADFQRQRIKDETIIFPPSVMKAGKEHIIPFLSEWEPYLPNQSSNSWARNKPGWTKIREVTGYVIHDLMRYLSTSCVKIGVPLHIKELILDHRRELTGVAVAYNRCSYLDEMRDALWRYRDWLSSTVLRHVKT